MAQVDNPLVSMAMYLRAMSFGTSGIFCWKVNGLEESTGRKGVTLAGLLVLARTTVVVIESQSVQATHRLFKRNFPNILSLQNV